MVERRLSSQGGGEEGESRVEMAPLLGLPYASESHRCHYRSRFLQQLDGESRMVERRLFFQGGGEEGESRVEMAPPLSFEDEPPPRRLRGGRSPRRLPYDAGDLRGFLSLPLEYFGAWLWWLMGGYMLWGAFVALAGSV